MGDQVIALTNRAPHIRGATHYTDGSQALVVVEANLKDPGAYAGRILDDFVEALLALQASDPAIVAEHATTLLKEEARYRAIGAVFYAGVWVRADRVDLCTAGDIRVHLVDGKGNVLQVTRDHNAVSDASPADYDIEGSPPGFLENVPTRALPTWDKAPECSSWTGPVANATLIVCSSRVHRYRDPNDYIRALIVTDGVIDSVPDLGFAASMPWPEGEDSMRY